MYVRYLVWMYKHSKRHVNSMEKWLPMLHACPWEHGRFWGVCVGMAPDYVGTLADAFTLGHEFMHEYVFRLEPKGYQRLLHLKIFFFFLSFFLFFPLHMKVHTSFKEHACRAQ